MRCVENLYIIRNLSIFTFELYNRTENSYDMDTIMNNKRCGMAIDLLSQFDYEIRQKTLQKKKVVEKKCKEWIQI